MHLNLIAGALLASHVVQAATTRSSSKSTSASDVDTELPTLSLATIEDKIYYLNVTVGEPAQELSLRIDLIRDQTWVQDSRYFITCDDRYGGSTANKTALSSYDVNSTIAASNVCASQGVFNISDSTSVEYITPDYQATNDSTLTTMYADEELNFIYIGGQFIQDSFQFEDESFQLEAMDFVAANYSNVLAGGLGLAATDESFDTFLVSCLVNGLINSTAYSLYLGRLDAESIELHLGGLDTSKLQGDFVEFDFIPYTDFDGNVLNNIPVVPLTGLSVASSSGEKAPLGDSEYYQLPALLDSRTYYNYLPYDAVIDLALQLNAYYNSDLDRWLVDCDIGNLNASLDFQFGNLSISVMLSELIYTAVDNNGTELTFKTSGDSVCFMSVLPQDEEGMILLGTPFLRSIYLSVDADGRKLAMGQAYVPKFDESTKAAVLVLSSSTESAASVPSSAIATKNSSTTVATRSTKSKWGSTKTAISSGHIPFAQPNNISSYDDLLLTIMSGTASSRASATQDVIVSNGEVILQTSSSDVTSASHSASGTADASNAFSSSTNLAAHAQNMGVFAVLLSLLLSFL